MIGPVRGLLALLALLLLAGCWTGDAFYVATELRAPVAPGAYRLLGANGEDEPDHLHVTVEPSGLTRFAPPPGERDEPVVAGFAPFPGEANIFVGWLVQAVGETVPGDGLPYGLLEVRPDGEYRLLSPSCLEMEAQAVAAGATVLPDTKLRICRFPDRASLEVALRQLIPRLRAEGVRLVPAGG